MAHETQTITRGALHMFTATFILAVVALYIALVFIYRRLRNILTVAAKIVTGILTFLLRATIIVTAALVVAYVMGYVTL